MNYETLPNGVLRVQQPKYEELGGDKPVNPRKGCIVMTVIIMLIPALLTIGAIVSHIYEMIWIGLFFAAAFLIVLYVLLFPGSKKRQYVKDIIANPDAKAIVVQLEYKGMALREKVFSFESIKDIVLDFEKTSFQIGDSPTIFLIFWRLYLILKDAPPTLILKKMAGKKQFNLDDVDRAQALMLEICKELRSRVQKVNPDVEFYMPTKRDEMVYYEVKRPSQGLGMYLCAGVLFMLGLIIGIPLFGFFIFDMAIFFASATMRMIFSLLFGMIAIMVFVCGPIYFHYRKKEDKEW
jgi:hypothetical protein